VFFVIFVVTTFFVFVLFGSSFAASESLWLICHMKHAHSRRGDLPFPWPDPSLQVVLVEPEIPPNTGNIARLCAATGTALHLVEPLGFKITDPQLKRAGLDYWDSVMMGRHAHFEAYLSTVHPERFFLFSTGAKQSFFDAKFQTGDALVFGSETRGLPDALLKAHPEKVFGIPIRTEHVRSLNLSSAVAIVVYEALRQISGRLH
jgi:tRNA (cytidine/uridine-2'-O-)-methyltransferase